MFRLRGCSEDDTILPTKVLVYIFGYMTSRSCWRRGGFYFETNHYSVGWQSDISLRPLGRDSCLFYP